MASDEIIEESEENRLNACGCDGKGCQRCCSSLNTVNTNLDWDPEVEGFEDGEMLEGEDVIP